MRPSYRKAIAGSEIVGGGAVVLLTLLAARHQAVPAWYVVTLESLAVLSIAAGIWLWRDEERGWRLSRLLQGLQVIQLVTPAFSFALVVGIQLLLFISPHRAGFTPGVLGSLSVALRRDIGWAVGINLFSLAAFLGLLRRSSRVATLPAVDS
jgi:hypothetical protein